MLSLEHLILISTVSVHIASSATAQELLEVQDLDREVRQAVMPATSPKGPITGTFIHPPAVQVDLTSQLVKVTHSLTIKNVGRIQTQQYAVCFPMQAAAQLAYLEVQPTLDLCRKNRALKCLPQQGMAATVLAKLTLFWASMAADKITPTSRHNMNIVLRMIGWPPSGNGLAASNAHCCCK